MGDKVEDKVIKVSKSTHKYLLIMKAECVKSSIDDTISELIRIREYLKTTSSNKQI